MMGPSDPKCPLCRTKPIKHTIIPRLIAGLPLVGIGVMHLTGSAPMKVILEAANIPMPDLNAVVAPIIEVIAGALILVGLFTRLGALLAVCTMVVALYAHLTASWPDEPPIVLPIVVLVCAAYLLYTGAGRWSLDAKGCAGASPTPAG